MMLEPQTFFSWLLTAALLSACLLAAVACLDRLFGNRWVLWREWLWRMALFGGLAIATLQFLSLDVASRLHRRSAAPIAATTDDRPHGAVAAPPQSNLPASNNSIDATASTSAAPRPAHSAAAAASSTAAMRPGEDNRNVIGTIALPSPSLALKQTLALIWLIGCALGLGRTGWRIVCLARALREAQVLEDATLGGDLMKLAQAAQIATPRLLHARGFASPLALSGHRIVVPDWALSTLQPDQLRAMLAHETAHLLRQDPRWKLAVVLWRNLFWFVPLGALAQRRLDDLAELACDAFAARRSHERRSLAECLAACAERHVANRRFDFVPAMAARRSSLITRIERLLEGAVMDTSILPKLPVRIATAMALGSAAIVLPVITFQARAAHAEASVSIVADGLKTSADAANVSVDTSQMTINVDADGRDLSAHISGSIEFSVDGRDIVRLGKSSTARFEESKDGVTYRFDLTGTDTGIQRRYRVDGKERPYDDEARARFNEMLPAIIRESGFNAEARVRQLFASGGAASVFDETKQIQSSYVRGLYLKQLMQTGPLKSAELDEALDLAEGIDSGYEQHQALSAIFDTQTLSVAQQARFIRAVQSVDTDYDRAQLLLASLPRLADDEAVMNAWFDATATLESDYEHSRCLLAFVADSRVSDALIIKAIEGAENLESDHERGGVLAAAIARAQDARALAAPYARATQKFDSDFDRRQALIALIKRGELDSVGARAVLESVAQIGSDYERRLVLVALAPVMPIDAPLVARYRQITGEMATYERDQADRALTF